MTAPRAIRVLFQTDRGAADRRGLLALDPRVRTLCRVLVSYPEVRHIAPDCISLDAGVDERTLQTVARFLERQQWLVRSVALE